MTPEEARAELMKRFPRQTVNADLTCWYHSFSIGITAHYRIAYNFTSENCSSKEGNSFEDCFSQLDQDDAFINKTLKKYSILLRQF